MRGHAEVPSGAMPRAPKPPGPIYVDPLTCKAERPPTARDARWWWRGSYTASGKTRHVTLGRGTEAEIRERAFAVVRSGLSKEPRPAAPGTLVRTVRDVCDFWLGHQETRLEAKELAPRSLLCYRASVRRLVKADQPHQLGDLLVGDLDEGRIEDYALARAKDGGAPKTINDDVSALMMAWKWCRRRKLIVAGELFPKPLKPRAVRPTRTPSREEVVALIRYFERTGRDRYALLVHLQYATGARVGEIAAMEWADVDLDAGVLRLGIHEGFRKTGERLVPVVDEVVARMRAWRERPPERPFWGRVAEAGARERWVLGVAPVSSVSRLGKYLPDACVAIAQDLGLDPAASRVTSHAFRRWAVDEMGREGVEPAAAASTFGHSVDEMHESYRRPDLEDRRAAVSRARLGVLQGGKAS